MRQDFAGYNYGLVDKDTEAPLPVRNTVTQPAALYYHNNDYSIMQDFWLSKLVGSKVLDVEGSTTYGRNFRAYAHCAKSP